MFDNVLVGVDEGQGSRDAIALARILSAPKARMTLGRVYSSTVGGRAATLSLAAELERSEELLAQARAEAGTPADTALICDPSPGRGLQQLVEERDADVLVVGMSHRGRLGRVLLGDDTAGALDRAACPLAIAPSGYAARAAEPVRIGVGYDGSAESEQALAVARELCAEHGSQVNVRLVLPEHETASGKTTASLPQRDAAVSYGEPGPALADLSSEFDLLVIGSRRRGPISRLLTGSTSRYLARHAHCPLLVVPGGRASTSPSP